MKSSGRREAPLTFVAKIVSSGPPAPIRTHNENEPSILLFIGSRAGSGNRNLTTPAHAADKKAPFKVKGLYLEGCSCGIPCPCELSGLAKGCEGVGTLVLESGSYDGQKLDGAKVACATIPGKWVRLYIESKNAAVRKSAEAFARNAFEPFGKTESVEDATIAVTGKEGNTRSKSMAGRR